MENAKNKFENYTEGHAKLNRARLGLEVDGPGKFFSYTLQVLRFGSERIETSRRLDTVNDTEKVREREIKTERKKRVSL